jgi:hypothetical protein
MARSTSFPTIANLPSEDLDLLRITVQDHRTRPTTHLWMLPRTFLEPLVDSDCRQ